MSNLEIWNRRWQALSTIITQLKNDIDTLDQQLMTAQEKKEHRIPTFKKLITSLEEFATSQFEFFLNGFYAVPSTLEESVQFPPEYVLRRTLDQISLDLMVIKTAFDQRNETPIQLSALKQADLLAFRSIEPVLGNTDDKLLPEKSTIVTYFQKVPQVRIIPYGNATLIGLPYTATVDLTTELFDVDSNLRELLAIPHEIGHFIFWYGRLKNERLHIRLRQGLIQAGLGKYDHWLEEIFADVYGTLVAGSVFALSAQDIQLDNLPARLTSDDGSHPSGVLRPYISLRILELFAGANAASILQDYWEQQLEKRGKPTSFQLNNPSYLLETIAVASAIQQVPNGGLSPLNKIIQIIIDVLDTNAFQLQWGNNNPPNPLTDGSLLYKSFFDNLKNHQLFQVQAFDTAVPDDFNVPDDTNSWVHFLRPQANAQNKMPVEVWKIVFDANGWGTGGGESDGAGKDLE